MMYKIYKMKRTLYVYITFLLFGCGSGENTTVNTGDLVGSIESKAVIGDLTAEFYESSWLNVAAREKMITDWFKKIEDGNFEVFLYIPDTLIPLTTKELQYQFHHIDTEYIELSFFETDTILVEETIDLDGIVYLKFKEELYYDDQTGLMSKRIKYACPMEKVFNDDGSIRGYKGLFWVKLNLND